MKKTYRKYTPFVTGAANSTTALNAVVNSLQDDVQQLYMDFLSRYEYVTTGIPRWRFRDSSAVAPAGDKQLRNLEIGVANPDVITFNGRSKTQIGNTELQLAYGPRNSFPHEETTLAMDVPFCTFKFQDLSGHVGFIYFVPKNTTLGACFTKDTTIRLRENTTLTVDTATVTGYGAETAVAYSTNTFYTKYDFEFCLDVTGANSLANLVAILNGIVSSPFDVYAFDPIPITIDNTEYSAITSYDRYGIFYDQAFNLTISSTALEKTIEYMAEMLSVNPTIPPVGSQERTYIIYAKLPYVLFSDPVNATEGILTTSTKNPSDFSITTAASIVRSWDDEFVTSQIIGAGSFYGDKYTLIPLFWRTWDLFASIDGTSIEKEDLYLSTTPFVNNTFIPSVAAGTVILPMSGTNSHTHTFIKNSGLLPGVWDSYVNLTNSKELFVEVNNTPLIYGSSSALKLGSTSIGIPTTVSLLSGNLTYFSVSSFALSVYTHSPTNRESLIINLNDQSRTARFGSSSLATDYDLVLQNSADTNLSVLSKDLGAGTYKSSILVGVHEAGTINKDYLYTTLVTDPAQDRSYIFSSALNGLEIGITDRAVSDYDDYIINGLDYTKTETGSIRLQLKPMTPGSTIESGTLILKHANTIFLNLQRLKENAVWYTSITSGSDALISLGTVEETAVPGEYSGTGVRVDSHTSSEVAIITNDFYIKAPGVSTASVQVNSDGQFSVPGQFGFQFGSSALDGDLEINFESANSNPNPYFGSADELNSLLFVTANPYSFATIQGMSGTLPALIESQVVKHLLLGTTNIYYFYIPTTPSTVLDGYYIIEATLPSNIGTVLDSSIAGTDQYNDMLICNRFVPYLEFIQMNAPLSGATISDVHSNILANTDYSLQKSLDKYFSHSNVGHYANFSTGSTISFSAYLTGGKYYVFRVGSHPTTALTDSSGMSTLRISRGTTKTNGSLVQPIFGAWTPNGAMSGMSVKFLKLF